MNRLLRTTLPYIGLPFLMTWMSTMRARWCGSENYLAARERHGRAAFCFWHEDFPAITWMHRGCGARVMVSRHADGDLIARILSVLGYRPVRGSTTRGGSAALRQMAQGGEGDLVITPDGPKGPRRRVQLGIVQLAALTKLPLVPVSLGLERCKRLRSWDRTALPKPFTRAVLMFGEPLEVRRGEKPLEDYRRELEEALLRGTEATEQRFDELYRSGTRRAAFDRERFYFFTRETSSR